MAGTLRNISLFTKLASVLPTSVIKSPTGTISLRGGPSLLTPSCGHWRQQPCVTLREVRGKLIRTHWKELPQPEMKPIGPEDYNRWSHFLKKAKELEPKTNFRNTTARDVQISDEVFRRVNQQIETKTHGRVFAVVRIQGKQFKVTANDIIVIQGEFSPVIGDSLRLEKVLLVGTSDFTLVGRPLLGKDMVAIEATVIEKTLSQIYTHFKMKPKKQYRRIHFYRHPYTMLRINDIQLVGRVNEVKDFEGLEGRIL